MLNKELLTKYKILQLIQRGFGGDVWLAEHMGLSGRRVIKAIDRNHPWHDILKNEAKVLQQCHHPSIPIIYDILEFDTQTYIIEEYIEGETLKQYILRRKSLSDSFLLTYSIQLCEILQYIHHPSRNILHLDLKPENLLLSNHRLKLVDFGSAICRNQQTTGGAIFGTPQFCAPEQKNAGELTEETDIYSLGKCMEYMLRYAERIPKGYRKIVENCLRNGSKRYRQVEEIRKELEKLRHKNKTEEPKELWFAVAGAGAGQDSNLFAVMLAAYLRRRYKKKVLYLDCSGGPMPEILRGEEDGFVTEKDGVVITGRVAPEEAAGFCDRGYRYIICDFGNGTPAAAGCLFSGCFLVGAMTEWTTKQWQRRILELGSRTKPVLVLTGGTPALAKKEFRDSAFTVPWDLHFSGFGDAPEQRRMFRSMLRRMK